jgi:ABC-2 type transport system ATP-binding protein
MISVKHVSKVFGPVRAVSDMSLEIAAGQIVGLLGPNGAGKTTTLRMVTGYLPPSAGSVAVCGHDSVTASMDARRSLGYLPEAAPLYPEMRVRDYLTYRAKLFGMGRRDRRAAIARVVERCWLGEVAHRRTGQLSKGYKQRVGLAGAMIHDPPVLVLDEPTSGLDPAQIRETRALIKELSHRRTVIVSSHILPEVERTCDRVVIIARGRLRADGAPGALVQQHRGNAACIVEVRSTEWERASGAIRALPAVARVEHEAIGEWVRGVVTPGGNADVRETVAGALRSAGVLCRELTTEAGTLEQVYLKVIESDDPAAAAGSEREKGGVR